MKIQFNRDFGEFKAGQVVEMSEDEADDHRQAGRASLYVESAQVLVKPKPKSKPAAKK